MQATFYSFSKRSNSTKQPTVGSGTTLEIKLKANCSFENPIFTLVGFNNSWTYFDWNNHFYFIDDVISINNDIVEVHGSMDALGTYKSNIGAMSAYIERSSSDYNTFFNDNFMSSRQDIISESNAVTTLTGITGGQGCYVLRIAGGDLDGISTYVAQDLAVFGRIFDKDSYIGQTEDPFENLGLIIFDPFKYVVSLSWCPLEFTLMALYGTPVVNIYVKWYPVTLSGSCYKLNDNAFLNSTQSLNKPNAYYSDFRAYNPRFTEYNIYIPSIGNQTLSPEHTKGDLILDYEIDLNTGDVFFRLVSTAGSSGNSTIATYESNIFRQIQIGNDSFNASSVVQSIATVGAGSMSLAGGNVAGGLLTVASGTISTLENILTPMPSILGSNGGISLKLIHQVIISQIVRGSGGYDLAHLGRPLNETRVISTLSGFVKCAGASINISATESERQKINNFLNSGFYYE